MSPALDTRGVAQFVHPPLQRHCWGLLHSFFLAFNIILNAYQLTYIDRIC